MSKISQRPGVYSDYEASGIVTTRPGVRAAGLAADFGELAELTAVYSASAASGVFDGEAAKLCALLLENGAAYVVCSPVTDGDYDGALERLGLREDVYAVMCDRQDVSVLTKLNTMVMSASEQRREKLAVGGITFTSSDRAAETAAKLNSERFVLAVGEEGAASLAASLAGAVCCQTDPALPLNGVELYGITAGSFSDEEIDALILGGVTPVEDMSGSACIVRAVTTRTSTSGIKDSTWRELTTIMIVDEVIPAVRTALRSRFSRSKNTAQTRGAVRTQVVLELGKLQKRQIIDSYGDVAVEADEEDPTTCNVGFDFTVAHGMNRIHISAVIEI